MKIRIWLEEGLRMLRRKLRVEKHGWKKYQGLTISVCKNIVNDCWNGRYFQTSSGHFSGFYIRDFGWTVPSLLKLGHRKKVHQTLDYALQKYMNQSLTTTISPSGECVDVFSYAPDSLAWLLFSIATSKYPATHQEKRFLQSEIDRFVELAVDPSTKLVRADKSFSSIKDHAKRKSSTYDNWMFALVIRDAKSLGLQIPFSFHETIARIIRRSWNGSFFADDATDTQRFSADSALFGFGLGLISNREMLDKTIAIIESKKISQPVGLAYDDTPASSYNFASLFSKEYERSARWMHLGMMYLVTLSRFKHPKLNQEFMKYVRVINRDRNFLEVYDPQGNPFRSTLYFADEGMIWAALLAGAPVLDKLNKQG